MGYTHYWTLENGVEESAWSEFFDGAAKILETAKDAGIQLEDDSLNTVIHFNGVGEGAHETFAITPLDVGFNFCKTAEKPYDTVVTAILILLKETLRENVKVTSDGDWNDWQGGQLLYETVFDKQPESILG